MTREVAGGRCGHAGSWRTLGIASMSIDDIMRGEVEREGIGRRHEQAVEQRDGQSAPLSGCSAARCPYLQEWSPAIYELRLRCYPRHQTHIYVHDLHIMAVYLSIRELQTQTHRRRLRDRQNPATARPLARRPSIVLSAICAVYVRAHICACIETDT